MENKMELNNQELSILAYTLGVELDNKKVISEKDFSKNYFSIDLYHEFYKTFLPLERKEIVKRYYNHPSKLGGFKVTDFGKKCFLENLTKEKELNQDVLHQLGFKRNGYGTLYLSESRPTLFSLSPYNEVFYTPRINDIDVEDIYLRTKEEIKHYIDVVSDRSINKKWLQENKFIEEKKGLFRKTIGRLKFYSSFPYNSVGIKEKGKEVSLWGNLHFRIIFYAKQQRKQISS